MSEWFAKLAQAVIDGDPEKAKKLAQQALEQGLDPMACISKGLTKGMDRVGELFANGEYFLPDLIIGGEAMKAALSVLEPVLVGGQERETMGRVILGTVKGDLHEIGKTLVGTMLTANGFQVIDIGVDRSADEFIAAIEETNATLVGASALLTTTIPEQQKIVEALTEAGLRDKVKMMVGGAPVTQAWADEIGADGYGEDAIRAVTVAKRLTGVSA